MKNKIITALLILFVLFNLLTFLTPFTWWLAIPLYLLLFSIIPTLLKKKKRLKRMCLLVPLIPVPLWLWLFINDYFVNNF
ncbi:MAG: hypothetical protein AAGA66_09270 [Bacteroidota bacterium]